MSKRFLPRVIAGWSGSGGGGGYSAIGFVVDSAYCYEQVGQRFPIKAGRVSEQSLAQEVALKLATREATRIEAEHMDAAA
jgi:hypothetical protein